MIISRRNLLKLTASVSLLSSPLFNVVAAGLPKKNLIILILRGGLDGLSTVFPSSEKNLLMMRPDLIEKKSFKLSSDFNLNPELKFFNKLWLNKKATVVHATNIPYTGRSHFDGQNLMESGGRKPYELKTGWLGRGLEASGFNSVALSLHVPLLLRNTLNENSNFFPTIFKIPSIELIEKVQKTYDQDHPVNKSLHSFTSRPVSMMSASNKRNIFKLINTSTKQISSEDGPRVAVIDIGGFDTHSQQSGLEGELTGKLRFVDKLFQTITKGLGKSFEKSIILTLTEFGRSIRQNGGLGTDHGYGSSMLLAGGLLKTNQVFTDWPGLNEKFLFEGRDLLSTIDARSIYCSAMSNCFYMDFNELKSKVFYNENLTDYSERIFKI